MPSRQKKPPKAAKKRQPRLLDKKSAFLKAVTIRGSIMAAADDVGMDRGLHYDWLKDDPKYPARFNEAIQRGNDFLDDIATERATKGVFRPLIYQGQFCFAERQRTLCLLPDGREVFEEDLPAPIGDVKVQSRRVVFEKYGPPLGVWEVSNEMLRFKLRGAFAKYRAGSLELTGKDGGPVEIGIVERLNAARARLAKAKESEKP